MADALAYVREYYDGAEGIDPLAMNLQDVTGNDTLEIQAIDHVAGDDSLLRVWLSDRTAFEIRITQIEGEDEQHAQDK